MVGDAAAPTKLVGFANPLNPPYGYCQLIAAKDSLGRA
jgi:hypothetical protein